VSKGILVRYKSGKKFFYKSTVDKIESSKKAIESVSSQFFEGSYVNMLRFIEKECDHLLV
jgi:predicted transcriptional regulator